MTKMKRLWLPRPAAAAAADLAQLKADALARFAVIADLFSKMGKAYEKYGYLSEQYNTYQAGITEELMAFRFTAKQWMLCAIPCAVWLKKFATTNAASRIYA